MNTVKKCKKCTETPNGLKSYKRCLDINLLKLTPLGDDGLTILNGEFLKI